MIRRFALFAPLLLLVAGCGGAAPADGEAAANAVQPEAAAAPEPPPAPEADIVHVRLETDAGPITLALDVKRAPITAKNFLAYVDRRRFDGTAFYRAAPTPGTSGSGFIQGGINRSYRRMLPPIVHEPTSKTGLRHKAGVISMARAELGTAAGEFFITASALPQMDARSGEPGYAAFGHVTQGMGTVRKILASRTIPNAGRGPMRGQMIEKQVKILKAERVAE